MRHVLCFNTFSRFTWFNVGRITNDNRCFLIKGLWTEKNGVQRLIKEFLNKSLTLSSIQASDNYTSQPNFMKSGRCSGSG